MVKKAASILLPAGSARRKAVKKLLVMLHLKTTAVAGYYNTWLQQQRENPETAPKTDLSAGPLISVVVPAYNTPRRYIDELVYSIISQSYENWELVLVNVSTDSRSAELIDSYAEKDRRIRVLRHPNESIAANTNAGITAAKGEYIAFVDHDDVIEPFALAEMAGRIVHGKAELIYSDEDKISDNSEIFFDPHFKPDWSPDLLTHVNYINHLTVIKKALILEAGLLDPAKDGAQDYDLLLRVTDLRPRIAHVPKVLYHWRSVPNSTAQDFSSKKNITDAGKASLEEHFKRQGAAVKAVPKERQPGFYELVFPLPTKLSVTILPFASDALLRLFVEMLIKRSDLSQLQLELLLPDGTQPRFESDNVSVKVVKNGAQYLKNAIGQAQHPEVVIFDQIVLPQAGDWLAKLCGPLSLNHVGAVAPLIIRDGSIIEDAGMVVTAAGYRIPLFADDQAFNRQTFFGNTNWVRDVDALTGGVTAVRAKELKTYLESADTAHPTLTDYSLANTARQKYNVVFPEVMVDNYSIRLQPETDGTTFFSPSLLASGDDYEPYTPESAAINILQKLNEEKTS